MTHDPVQARRVVLISIVALLGIAAYRGQLNTSSDPFAKRVWGTGVLAIMLGLLADFAPQIAAPFSILVVVGSLTNGGETAINSFLSRLSGGGGGGSSSSSSSSTSSSSSSAAAPGSTPTTAPPSAHSPGPSNQ